MNRAKLLNERQRAVLTWISRGCPDGVMDGTPFKTTAAALQDRRLITVSRSGGSWSSTITDAGRYYLEHDDYPDGLKTRWARRQPGVSTSMSATATASSSAGSKKTVPAGIAGFSAQEAAKQILLDVQAAGGTLTVSSPSVALRAAYRRGLHSVAQQSLVPAGHKLLHTGRDKGDLIIRLAKEDEPEADWNRIRLNVRRASTELEDILAALDKDSSAILQVSDEARDRAVRLVRRLAREAPAAGLQLGVSTKRKNPDLFLLVDQERRSVLVYEQTKEVRRPLTVEEQMRKIRSPWRDIPETRQVPSGLLRLEVGRSGWGRVDKWVDAVGDRLEKRLQTILQEVIDNAATDNEERLRALRLREQQLADYARREAEERRRWEEARAEATVQAREARRRRIAGELLEQWEAADRLRRLSDTMEAGTPSPSTQPWIRWLEKTANELDPLTSAVLERTPFDTLPTEAELEPFMGELTARRPGDAYRSSEEKMRLANQRRRHRHWWRRDHGA